MRSLALALLLGGAASEDDAALLQLPLRRARDFELVTMEEKAVSDGAVCLDGKPAAFYIARASRKPRQQDWVIYLHGGGWCTTPWDCFFNRANASYPFSLGSDASLPAVGPPWMSKGLTSLDCKENPVFCDYNQVFVPYCDGTSFSGDVSEPLPVPGSAGESVGRIFFRGKRILKAVVDTLFEEHGLRRARNVLFTGCSAGGLAALLHADTMHERMRRGAPELERFGTVPVSGFFLARETTIGYAVYTAQMQNLFEIANWTTPAPACSAQLGKEAWKCNFAKVAYQFLESPVFIVNSALDQWQTKCIRFSKIWDSGRCPPLPGVGDCPKNVTRCTAAQLPAMNEHMDEFVQDWRFAETSRKRGNGAFIDGCHYHCEGNEDAPFRDFEVDGVTMRDALLAWWNSSMASPAAEHTHVEQCRYGKGAECNPTCTVKKDVFR